MARSRVPISKLLLVALCAVLFNGCTSHQQLEELASRGEIHQEAPVKAELETTIDAPAERVFGLLADVKNWPSWHAVITDAILVQPVSPGTEFSWKMEHTQIYSRMALVNPPSQLAWTGRAMGAHAIHVWKLVALPDGKTTVRVSESMDGPLLGLLYSSKELVASDQAWLDDLKKTAELPR